MKLWISTVLVCVWLAGALPAQEPPPAEPPPVQEEVFGFERDPFQDSSQPGNNQNEQELTLELRNEPDGPYVAFTDFLNVLRSIDPNAHGEWDGILGVFRITAAGRSMQALANQPVLVIDGRYRAVSKPLRVRGGVVLVPIQSVQLLLKALNFEFEIEGGADTAVPTPPPDPNQPSVSAPPTGPVEEETPPPTVPMSIVAPRVTPSSSASSPLAPSTVAPLVSPLINESLPPLETPNFGGTVSGLTWGQLADALHSRAPSRLTIVCDPPLTAIAERVSVLLSRAIGLDVTIHTARGGRDNPGLIGDVTRSRPDLAIDLMLVPGPANAPEGEVIPESQAGFEVWAVHEALWPGEGRAPAGGARPMHQMYKLHQFQNLALGSMLRGELSRGFPERNVNYSLTPSYVLRRVDAPSAAVLLPLQVLNDESGDVDRVARAIAGGVVAYCRGIESAARR